LQNGKPLKAAPIRGFSFLTVWKRSGDILPLAMCARWKILILLLAAQTLAGAQQERAAPETAPSRKHSRAEITKLIDQAGKGDAATQVVVGQAYAEGNGVDQNFDLAMKWYQRAADQGNADAENAIGVMYRTGSGVDQSKEEALLWYRKAARQGNGLAMFNLGTAYYNGDGLDVSDPAAYAWFTLAKQAGVSSAADAVARMDRELRPWQINDGLKMLADMYAKGEAVKQDDTASANWYRKAAERGDKEAQVKLAAVLMAGRGVPRDYEEARKWCETAAKQRSTAGEVCLGYLYRAGLGVEKNSKEAVKHLSVAVQWNNSLAMRMLGEMYVNGETGKVDKVQGFLWYVRAAVGGDDAAKMEAAKIKSSMQPEEQKSADKKMRELGMDPQKVEAFLR
jgi:uncharacterized protein